MIHETQSDERRNEISAWVTDKVAGYLDRPPGDIAPDVPFAAYGLQSVYALALCGDVEDEFGIAVEPSLAWDHPTVAALAAFLVETTTDSPR